MTAQPSQALCAFLDAPAGCAGDMFLGALVALGVEPAFFQDLADRMGLDDVTVAASPVTRGAFAATKVDVVLRGVPVDTHGDVHHTHHHETSSGHHPHGHTTLADVTARLARLGDLEQAPWSQAHAAFRALAEAEAKVHGTTPEAVHFHEVGAADALVDIAGTCAGLHHLGVRRVVAGPLPWGQGTIDCAHGTMPNPAPATVELLTGHPTVPSTAQYEQVTPTGAALVRVLSSGTAPPPGFTPTQVGIGAGTHPGEGLPNVVRIVLGTMDDAPTPRETVLLLETNLDDASGQVIGRALERLLAEGALDVWTTPVTMKKGRPGVIVSALCPVAARARVEAVFFRETPTLGVRVQHVERSVLPRTVETVETPWGTVRVKVRTGPDGREATPEYDDCRQRADEHDVPVRRVLEAALQSWRV